MDTTDFFKQATLLICSSLDIEKGLHRCIGHLARFIPISAIYLNRFEQDLGIIRCLAMVTREGVKKRLPSTPLPRDAVRLIESTIRKGTLFKIVNEPEKDPIARQLLKKFDLSDISVFILPLVVEGNVLGAMGIMAKGKEPFTKTHESMLIQLREPFALAMSNALRHREIKKLKEMVEAENRELHRELGHHSNQEIVGADFGLKQVMEMVRQVAPVDTPVILLGETGVGKEVIANAIHRISTRGQGPLIKVNCGAIPGTLLDSELFGHEKGAFTGALTAKAGRFERANNGSIFLDEIGELSPRAQVRLLRVIQNREIERVGGRKGIPVNVRVIAATHRNLEQMITSGQFREDLWYRLNTFPIIIPPLRHRKEDIPALVHHFLEKKSKELKIHTLPETSSAEIERLKTYSWPGNVRELENLVERTLIKCRGRNGTGLLRFTHFTFSDEAGHIKGMPPAAPGIRSLDEAMIRHIRQALILAKGKISGRNGAAQLLKINPNTLRSRMRKFGITPPR